MLGEHVLQHRTLEQRRIAERRRGEDDAFGGALLFGLPLLMTMEMWWLGFYIDRLRLLILPYTITAIPASVFVLSLIAMVEMSHVSSQQFVFLGVALNPTAAWSWLLLAGITLVSFFALRRTLPQLRAAWTDANTLPQRETPKDSAGLAAAELQESN